jgi:RNA polymerase sigma factor (sigma-70 family)
VSNDLQSAFKSLHKQYQPMVLHLCRGFVKGDHEQAHDLSQEVFINTWNALPSFRGDSSQKTWIYRITVNTCLMWIRKEKKKAQEVWSEATSNSATENSPGEHEQVERLYKAIGELEEVDRLIIMMVLDELEYEDISKVIGITENNLRVKVHRIKQRIKTLMTDGKGNG